ncbi:MAG: ribosome maturation factor RimP [Oligoflexales bacterium]
MNRDRLDQIITLVNQQISPIGYEAIEAEWDGSGRILRIYIDFTQAAERSDRVAVTDCIKANAALKECSALDEMISGPYNLEISSPGLERPLRFKDHFKRFIGEEVRVNLTIKIGARANGQGKLVDVSAQDEVILETGDGQWVFPLQSVKKAHLVYKY